jgi:hypothetical protein
LHIQIRVSNIAAYLFGLSRQLDRPLRCNRWGFFIMEIWKPIKDYESLYEISTLGEVKSLNKKLKPYYNSNGYLIVKLYKDSIKKTYRVHRLVAETFLENTNQEVQVNHKNFIRDDNRIENLEWVSNLENCCHKNSINKYPGVTYHKQRKKWRARIHYKYKQIHLGLFDTEEEAYQARLNFELNNNIKNKYI